MPRLTPSKWWEIGIESPWATASINTVTVVMLGIGRWSPERNRWMVAPGRTGWEKASTKDRDLGPTCDLPQAPPPGAERTSACDAPLRSPDMRRRPDQGWIEVISGPMFSGKSEELIRRITRYHLARVPTQTFKPSLDDRFADNAVVSHSKLSTEAEPVESSAALLSRIQDRTVVVGIDEGQFFDDDLVDVASALASAGKQVIVAGLDLDYLGRPFEPIPSLMIRAEYVTKALAVCHRCGGPGLFTQRVVVSDELVVLGAEGAYEARCRRCYDPGEALQEQLELDA